MSSTDEDRLFPPNEAELRDFYQTPEWKRLAYAAKIQHGWRCQCCGASADDGVRIVSDHVRPARYYWHLRLERSNIQVMCEDCNHGKASWDQTDYRGSVKDRLLEAIVHYEQTERGTKLKEAIIAAHSFGALSQEEAVALIHRNGLESA